MAENGKNHSLLWEAQGYGCILGLSIMWGLSTEGTRSCHHLVAQTVHEQVLQDGQGEE